MLLLYMYNCHLPGQNSHRFEGKRRFFAKLLPKGGNRVPERHDELREFCDLLDRAFDGSEEAAAELVARYGDALRRAIRRALGRRLRPMFDSIDFAQDVWLSFFRRKAEMPRFERPEELIAFVIGMGRRKVAAVARDRLVRQRHNINRVLSSEESMAKAREIPDGRPAPMEVAIRKECLERFISRHPERDRRIIELRLQGLNDEQVAHWLGIAINTVRRFWAKLLG
jgi:RNA polymerase sigma factor (sigma-70 family)